MAACLSRSVSTARMLSRSAAARSNSSASDACCIFSCSSRSTRSVWPVRKAQISSSIAWYCARVTLPEQGAQHLPTWYIRQGRSRRAIAFFRSLRQWRTGKCSRTTFIPSRSAMPERNGPR